jgi:hypothetical protein
MFDGITPTQQCGDWFREFWQHSVWTWSPFLRRTSYTQAPRIKRMGFFNDAYFTAHRHGNVVAHHSELRSLAPLCLYDFAV